MAIMGCGLVDYRSGRPGGKFSLWIELSRRLLVLGRIIMKARHRKTYLQQRKRT